MPQPLLNGEAIDGEYAEVDESSLQNEISRLEDENRKMRAELLKVRQQSESAVAAITELRRQLTPLHRALRAVFGEIEIAIGSEPATTTQTPASAPVPNQKMAVWESWKERLPGYPAKFIDALLTHKDLDSRQLSIATGCHYNSVAGVIFKLNKAGLINKNGNRFSLKAL